MDIIQLGKDTDIPPEALKVALEDAARLMEHVCAQGRPASKRDLRGLDAKLANAIERLSEDRVRDRLVDAEANRNVDAGDDEADRYFAWWEAKERFENALDGAGELLSLLRTAEDFKYPPGRPDYVVWNAGISSLATFWVDELQRNVTISAHPDDPRNTRPSPAVGFVYRAMKLLDEKITEQACRTIWGNLQSDGWPGEAW